MVFFTSFTEDTMLPSPWVNLQEEIPMDANHVNEHSVGPYQLDQSNQIESLKTDIEVQCSEFTNLNNNPNHKLESIHWNHNAKLRIILYKELRKPGKSKSNRFHFEQTNSTFSSNIYSVSSHRINYRRV